MAFQINEKLLSHEVIKELQKVKNKSQFVRDALEYYVKREQLAVSKNSRLEKIEKEIEEIKTLIKQMTLQTVNEVVATKIELPMKNDNSKNSNNIKNTKPTNKIEYTKHTDAQKEYLEKLIDDSLGI